MAPRIDVEDAPEHGFALLLVLVLALAAFEVAAPDGPWARLVSVVLAAATLLAAVWASGARSWVARTATIGSFVVVIGSAVLLAVNGDVPVLVSAILNGVLVAVAPVIVAVGVVRDVRLSGAVTIRTLAGVLAIYVLAGMFFSFLFSAVEAVQQPFFEQVSDPERSDFLYFSYVTISTVGYGDLTAVDDVGRMLAVTEALLGQIYLVTVVALIVTNLRPRSAA